MKVSLNWLSDYIDLTIPATELASRLTMAGIGVEEIQITGVGWENVVVGKIVGVNAHPSADRLRLVTVDLGNQQPTVVCGAPNLTVGDKVSFAHVGARLIDADTGDIARLKPAKIRGLPLKVWFVLKKNSVFLIIMKES